jgi:ankyrin repeat protein
LLGCIQVLLDAGASLHHVDHQGNSPLHYAAALGLTLALKTFVNWQGDMGLTNKQGYTPPQLAAASLKYAKASLPQSSSRAARLYETISILHK